MSTALKEALDGLYGDKRRFLLMRIAGMEDVQQALAIVGANKGRYSTWCNNPDFVAVNRNLKELRSAHRYDAVRAIRKENQLNAAMLEQEIIEKMREEVASGELKLCKTHLGREVYIRLMSELEGTPAVLNNITWYDKVLQLREQGVLPVGEITNDINSEPATSEAT